MQRVRRSARLRNAGVKRDLCRWDPTGALAITCTGWPSTTVAFASDLAFHGSWGTCYQLGPGSIHVAHTPDEQITKADLYAGTALYVRLARELLRNPVE